MSQNHLLEPRLNTADICRITTWSRWTVKRRIDDGTFPKPQRLGTVKHDTWRESVIAEWMENNTHILETGARYGT